MKQFKIGKDTVNDHVIENDPTVSRVHLAVFIDDEKNIFVTDLGSTNGTYVNGVRIVESVKLKTYDILRIGNTLVNWKRFLDDDDNLQIDSENLKYANLRLYINRHIEVDSSRHGPLSLKLFEYTCNDNQETYDEAISYAIDSIDKRIQLWDGVLAELSGSR